MMPISAFNVCSPVVAKRRGNWWGGPPGPRPTPPSACSRAARSRPRYAGSGTRASRADRGVRPTNGAAFPLVGQSKWQWERLGWGWFSMGVLLNQFQEHASGGGGMDEDVSMAAGARAGLVEQSRPAGLEAGDGGVEVRHAQGDVVQSGAAFFEELRDGRIGRGGFEPFDAGVAGGEHGDVHLLGDDGFAMGDRETKRLVEGDGLLQGG